MCGICGLVSLDGATAPDPAALAAMNESLVHRGPDSDGSLIDGPCGLAMRRLSIIDLAGGDQPIGNEDGRIQVIQNGEIYNYGELMDELRGRGHTFSTYSDTEVLVHLYEERGPAFVEALRGMFAIAIWDARHGRLVLARDRFGIKPLYYRVTGGWLSFGSELKALLRQPGFSREIALRRWAWSSEGAFGTRSGRTWSRTSRSACCSRGASTRRPSPRWPRPRAATG